MKRVVVTSTLLLLFSLSACISPYVDPRELDLRRSLRNYVESVQKLDGPGLENYVYFPDVSPRKYRDHVRELLTDYLMKAAEGEVVFDEQGVILSRFLRLNFHSYQVLEVVDIDERDLVMRIGINFNYDEMLKAAQYLPGTKVYIPSSPMGTVYIYTVNGENIIPRSQLEYIELKVKMRKTQMDGFYQIRSIKPDPYSVVFEDSTMG